MSISIYDPNLWNEKTPANVLGGINRSKNAIRDQLGRFMPSAIEEWENWKLDQEHGRRGGQTRIKAAVRDLKGRFIKGL